MHEYAITQNIVSIALDKAKDVKSSKITRVNVTLGELSGIVDESVEFYFGFLTKDTPAAGASIAFEKVPLRLRCRDCAAVFTPAEAAWACPACRKQSVEVIAGRECFVNSIEVD